MFTLNDLWPEFDGFGYRLSRPWVVTLVHQVKRQPVRHNMLVRATTEEGAKRTAREHAPASVPKRTSAYARLAHPVNDMGMVRVDKN